MGFEKIYDNLVYLTYGHIIKLIIRIFNVFPMKQRVMCVSFQGSGFGGNIKYIINELFKIDEDDIEVCWAVNNRHESYKNIKFIKHRTLAFYYYLATSKVWICDTRIPWYWYKSTKQFYIQTWHGGIALKKIEKDAESVLTTKYLKSAFHDSKMANLFISNSRFNTLLYRNAFWYDGEILECGYPRNDILVANHIEEANDIKYLKFGICTQQKIVLYAPTFRVGKNIDVYDIDLQRCLVALKEKYNDDFQLLVRFHPNISKMSKDFVRKFKCIDVTFYEDMQELLLIADVLITDYSSTMFEFALMQKPVFLYANDEDDYKADRGYYFELDSLPFSVSRTNDELYKNIISFDEVRYKENLKEFMKELGINETGKASSIVAKRIIREIGIV